MLRRTRVARTIDSARLSELVSRPGVDPRIWAEIAYVSKTFVDTSADGAGVYADVHLARTATLDADSGEVVAQLATVRVGTAYQGDGFGLYLPLQEGDEVLVVYPSGDPDEGGVIEKVLSSPSHPPPKEAKDHPADLLLHIEKDKSLRVLAFGGGNIVIGVEDGKVLLGSESGTLPVARKTDKTKADATMAAWISAVSAKFNAAAGPMASAPGSITPPSDFGVINQGSEDTESS